MTKRIKENLLSLSPEQLISIIGEYESSLAYTSEALVEESKWHISPKKVIKQIRKCLSRTKYQSLYNANLGDLIDYNNGKITISDLRKKIGLET